MILINLLPHREATRAKEKKQFFSYLLFSALLGLLIALGGYLWLQSQIANQESRNVFLRGEIAKLDEEIKDIAGLQAEIASLRSHQIAVEKLQADRNMPVHLLNEVVSRLPDGIFLRSMTQDGQNVLLVGAAQSQERVSELLRNLADQKNFWLGTPELVEIVASKVGEQGKAQRRVSDFTIRAVLKSSDAKNETSGSGEKLPAPEVQKSGTQG